MNNVLGMIQPNDPNIERGITYAMPENHIAWLHSRHRGHSTVELEMRMTLHIGTWACVALSIAHSVDTGEVGVIDIYIRTHGWDQGQMVKLQEPTIFPVLCSERVI